MASDEDTYWEQRHAIVPSSDHDASTNVERRLVLLIDIETPELISQCKRLRHRLEGYDCFLPVAADDFHITIKQFASDTEVRTTPNPVPSSAIDRVDTAISDAILPAAPFDIELPRFNLFPDVVYIEVNDGQRLTELNRRLCQQDDITALARDGNNFIPHLTLGYLSGAEEYHALVRCLEHERELPSMTVSVEELSLVAYNTTAEWPPTYEVLETYPLTS